MLCFIILIPFMKVKAAEVYPLTIQKYDQYSSKTAGIFKFKIRNVETGKYIEDDGSEVMETMWDGLYHTRFELGEGTYEIVNLEYPEHYFSLERHNRFTIDENTPSLDGRYIISDYVKKSVGQFIISRLGTVIGPNAVMLYNQLKDYQYDIYAEEDIMDDYGKIIFRRDTLMDTIVTDNRGIAYSKQLPQGQYYIKESGGRVGYQRQSGTRHATLAFDNDVNADIYYQREEFITEHNKLLIKGKIRNDNLVPKEVLDDMHFKLCKNDTNQCIRQYALAALNDKYQDISIDYGSYYLGLFSQADLLRKYDYVFDEENDYWEVDIDLSEFRNQKGEIIFEQPKEIPHEIPKEKIILPKTGKSDYRYMLSIFIIMGFAILFNHKQSYKII